MDAEWELVERSKAVHALTTCSVEVSELEAIKRDGNASFQQKRVADAIQQYSFVVDCCAEKQRLERDDTLEALVAMEIAVRLNRALAFIEQQEFAHAEDDCTMVLGKQGGCVKALYRRALARERLGKVQEAMDDIHAMLRLEPLNPAAVQLLDTLKTKCSSKSCDDRDAVELVDEVRKCSLTNEKAVPSPAPSSSSSRIELAEAAEQAWKLMQEDELRLRQTVQSSKPPRASRKQQVAAKTAVVTPAGREREGESEVFRKKTNDLWESLSNEEQHTVAKVYQKRRSNKVGK